jgi:hypothetical protein
MGLASAVVMPLVTIGLLLVVRIGQNAYCASFVRTAPAPQHETVKEANKAKKAKKVKRSNPKKARRSSAANSRAATSCKE